MSRIFRIVALNFQGKNLEIVRRSGFRGRLELNYRIVVRGMHPHPESYYQVPSGGGLRSEGAFKTGARPAEIADLSKDDIVKDFLREYRSCLAAVKP